METLTLIRNRTMKQRLLAELETLEFGRYLESGFEAGAPSQVKAELMRVLNGWPETGPLRVGRVRAFLQLAERLRPGWPNEKVDEQIGPLTRILASDAPASALVTKEQADAVVLPNYSTGSNRWMSLQIWGGLEQIDSDGGGSVIVFPAAAGRAQIYDLITSAATFWSAGQMLDQTSPVRTITLDVFLRVLNYPSFPATYGGAGERSTGRTRLFLKEIEVGGDPDVILNTHEVVIEPAGSLHSFAASVTDLFTELRPTEIRPEPA
jgi:hypothetical protein